MRDNPEEGQKTPAAPQESVSLFVKELSVARRHTSAYPAGHPLIVTALKRAVARLTPVTAASGELTLAAIRETLYANGEALESPSPAAGDLAGTFRRLGLAGVRFGTSTTDGELAVFLDLLNSDPAEVAQAGGIQQAAAAMPLGDIRVTGIDYSRLQATEQAVIGARSDDGRDIWEEFVMGLLDEGAADGTGESSDEAAPPGTRRVKREILERILGRPVRPLDVGSSDQDEPSTNAGAVSGADAALLARVVNTAPEKLAMAMAGPRKRRMFERFLEGLDRKGIPGAERSAGLRNLSGFLQKLDPEKQGEFLRDLLPALGQKPQMTEPLLSGLAADALADVITDAAAKDTTPPALLGILRKLAGRSDPAGAAGRVLSGRAPGESPADAEEKIRTIFREETAEDYVPQPYRASLDSLLDDKTPLPQTSEARHLGAQLIRMDPVEPQVARIIFQELKSSPPDADSAPLRENLRELCAWFLETGDFRTLTLVHDTMAPGLSADDRPDMPALSCFADPEALRDILNGLDFWGKEKFGEIALLIRKVGPPFVEPMLRKLADSPNMSVRRFLLDRISELGTAALPLILERLNDGRWYFVRNLVLLLRNIGDAEAAPRIRRHLSHPHPRVRQETVRTLLAFSDPEVENQIRADLTSRDRDVRLQAIQYATHSRSGEVLKELLNLLSTSSLFDFRLETKQAAVNALADTGHPGILPSLEKVLLARTFWHSHSHHELQKEIMKSLFRYPMEAAVDMLESVRETGRGAVVPLATETIRNLRRRKPRGEDADAGA